MTVDLRTRYLGLELRSPIVASAAPLNGDPATARRARTRRGRRRSSCRRCSRRRSSHEEVELDRLARAGHRALRRGARLLPGRRSRSSARPTATSTSLERVKAARRRARHRQPQRDARPAAGSRYARRIQDAGADALELNLYHVAADPQRPAPTWRRHDLDVDRRRSRRGRDPAGREAQPVLLGLRQLRGAARSRPAPTGSCCSTASTSPTSTSRRSRSCRGSS